jgi:hypothetical protein
MLSNKSTHKYLQPYLVYIKMLMYKAIITLLLPLQLKHSLLAMALQEVIHSSIQIVPAGEKLF